MKIYLASFLQHNNFGPGRLISIAVGKPKDLQIDFALEHLIPNEDLSENYKKFKIEKSVEFAAKYFEEQYKKDLDFFYSLVMEECKNNNCKPNDILGLQDGDTLLSWERFEFANYRKAVGELFVRFGFEVNVK